MKYKNGAKKLSQYSENYEQSFQICTNVNLLKWKVASKCSAKASCHGPIRPNELLLRHKWCSSTDADGLYSKMGNEMRERERERERVRRTERERALCLDKKTHAETRNVTERKAGERLS